MCFSFIYSGHMGWKHKTNSLSLRTERARCVCVFWKRCLWKCEREHRELLHVHTCVFLWSQISVGSLLQPRSPLSAGGSPSTQKPPKQLRTLNVFVKKPQKYVHTSTVLHFLHHLVWQNNVQTCRRDVILQCHLGED